MKRREILLLLIMGFSSQVCLAQKSFTMGVTLEGGNHYPIENTYAHDIKNNYFAGAGVWVMKKFHRRFSVDIGLTYRQKSYQQTEEGYYNLDYSQYTFIESWPYPLVRFKQDLLVVPFHIRIYPTQKFFLTGGFEHAFMVNLDADIKKDWEDNWLVGFGSQPGKLSWALTYSKGFDIRGAKRVIDGDKVYVSSYTNRILQLSLFYPIWQKK